MRLVVDTNVIIAALLRDSTTRRVLRDGRHELLVPERAFEEVEAHLTELANRMRVTVPEARSILAFVADHLITVPATLVTPYLAEARAALAGLDADDAVFVAAALATAADGIWTEDKALRRQTRVRTYSTRDLVRDSARRVPP